MPRGRGKLIVISNKAKEREETRERRVRILEYRTREN
jgi:hypothetical protein